MLFGRLACPFFVHFQKSSSVITSRRPRFLPSRAPAGHHHRRFGTSPGIMSMSGNGGRYGGGYGSRGGGRERGNGRGSGRGRGGGGRGGGYDWRKHVRPSSDPAVQNEARETIQRFLDSGRQRTEVQCRGEEKNTYRQYARQMGVGFARGNGRGAFQLMKFTSADPTMTLWKKIWCFYYRHYCDVDLIAVAESQMVAKAKAATAGENGLPVWDDIDVDVRPLSFSGGDDDRTVRSAQDNNGGGEDAKQAPPAVDCMHGTDKDEVVAIRHLLESKDAEEDAGEADQTDSGTDSKLVLDTTSNSFDGKRSWFKVRDLLSEIKQNDQQLWSECCSLGVNNCSERKLEPHLEKVQKFFDLQGRGPSQKIRGKKLKIAVGGDESVHFLEGEESVVVEYAKPVKFCDVDAIKKLIGLVDKANRSIRANTSSKSGNCSGDEDHLPANIFNDNWRKTRRNFDLGERLHGESMDPVYIERRDNMRKRLPAFNVGDEFCQRVFENEVVVLCGATGSGKTTQLPQILMEAAARLMHEQHARLTPGNDGRQFGTGRIICTQPRRISCTSVAQRVCYERNEGMGDRVGYQIRFEQRASDTTELLYCTTGIVLRFLVGNPKLEVIILSLYPFRPARLSFH